LALVVENCREILRNGFNSTQEEEHDFSESFLSEIKEFTIDCIKRIFKDVNTNLARRFKKEFEIDENGRKRNWVIIEVEKI